MIARASFQFPLYLRRIQELGGLSFARRYIHCWPASSNPTPYQIFGIDQGSRIIDKKQIRVLYYELVKIYHPDRGTTGNSDRFKRIVEARNILLDDSKRLSYDASMRPGARDTAPRYHYQKPRSPADEPDFSYWSKPNERKFDEGLRDNRMWLLKMISSIMVGVAILNLILLNEASKAHDQVLSAETERIASMLAISQGNYGVGGGPKERINRFLQHRQRTLDRFDGDFSWERMNSRQGGRVPQPGHSEARSSDPGAFAPHTGNDGMKGDTPVAPSSGVSQIGRPQAKHYTGPVAEYFGRN